MQNIYVINHTAYQVVLVDDAVEIEAQRFLSHLISLPRFFLPSFFVTLYQLEVLLEVALL